MVIVFVLLHLVANPLAYTCHIVLAFVLVMTAAKKIGGHTLFQLCMHNSPRGVGIWMADMVC